MSDDRVLLFGPYRLLVGQRRLLSAGVPVVLGSRAFDVLLSLALRQGQMATRDELMAEVWPGIVVEFNNLTTQISVLRRALGDGPDGQGYIATIPTRGYRFTAPVEIRLRSEELAGPTVEPSGAPPRQATLAFLCAAVEDAAGKRSAHPEAMPAAMARLQTLVAGVVAACQGDLCQATGDGVHAAFATAEDALDAAVAAQHALADADWSDLDGLSVAMAIHVGAAARRDGSYQGSAVTRTERLASLAHGGQVLLSGSAASLVRESLPPSIRLLELGEYRPDGTAPAEGVYQLTMAGRPQAFPPLRWREAVPHNLPLTPTALIGRETELADLVTLLDQHPIVSLCGTGGLGKTRLALEVGQQLLAQFPDGAWFVGLERLHEPELVAETIAVIFGLKARKGPALEAVLSFLRQKTLLLILDNAEHLIGEVARLSDEIAKHCPAVRIVVTTREVLGVPGEHVYRVPALDYPDRSDGIAAEQALRYAAVRLFTERAAAGPGGFTLSDGSAPVVAEICRRLDGIALAIELAAARLKLLTPGELLARLDDRFAVLTGGSRVALPRHQTLRATIDWSYNLLSEDERALLCRLSVFGGGFTIDDAIAVAAGPPVAGDMLDLISALVDKSLVVPEPGGAHRLRLLESTRAYAAEALGATGAAPWRRRLANHLVTVMRSADAAYETTPTADWLRRYGPEIDNLRAASDWAFGPGGETATGLALVAYGGHLCMELSLVGERQRWLAQAVPRVGPETPAGIAARLHLGLLPRGTSGVRSRLAAAEQGVTLAREAGDPVLLARALVRAASTIMGPETLAEAAALFEEAIAEIRPRGDTRLLASALNGLAAAYAVAGDFAAAEPLYAESGAVAAALGMSPIVIGVLSNRAEMACAMGDLHTAVALARRAVEAALEAGDRVRASVVYGNLSAYHLMRGETAAAATAAAEALGEAPALGEPFLAVDAIQSLALVAARSGDPVRAARLLGFVDAAYAADQKSREATEAAIHRLLVAALDETLPAGERHRLMAEGARWTEGDAAAAALAEAGGDKAVA